MLDSGSLRILQHVGTIKVPVGSLDALACTKPEEILWKEKRFKEGPGMITELIQVKLVALTTLKSLVYLSFVLVSELIKDRNHLKGYNICCYFYNGVESDNGERY